MSARALEGCKNSQSHEFRMFLLFFSLVKLHNAGGVLMGSPDRKRLLATITRRHQREGNLF